MVGLHVTATPPQPPPNVNEKVPSTRLEVILQQRSGLLLIKTLCYAAALAETAVILAARNAELPISQKIIANLVFSGSANNIRPTPLFFLGTFMTGLGGYIRYTCYRALGRLFTFEMSIRNNHQLITDGPYSVVRHPAYTGAILTVAGIICCHTSQGSWTRECGVLETKFGQSAFWLFSVFVSALTAGLMLRMSKEDAALKKTFGSQWDNWARLVPYSILPWIY
ncbi:hypothetical protein BYT27DRAFT_7083451 [Phlegmacium glaucopus]|nr:hypothetical protein BYT27DRAFT_7083451 [Phlegmacium glaucopus]